MKIMSLNNTNFGSMYQLNPKQIIQDKDICNLRNDYISMWVDKANNANQLSLDFLFINAEREPQLIFDIPDKLNKSFEAEMKNVGQEFVKIG